MNRHRHPYYATQQGFTVLEAMVALAIIAILLVIAVPTLGDLLVRNRISTEVNGLMADLYLARSEAIKRAENVVVCASPPTSTGCANQTWDDGWISFTDGDGNGALDGNNALLRNRGALPPRYSISGGTTIVYQGDGTVSGGSNTTLTFSDKGGGSSATKKIVVSLSGRVRAE